MAPRGLMEPDDSSEQPKAALFLSCAEEDEGVGGMLAERLEKYFQVFYWQQPRRGGQFIRRIEESINSADIFLAVLSHSYLKSYWCNQERMLALQREAQLQAVDPDATFIYVANVASMAPTFAGFFGSYVWLSMTSSTGITDALNHLGGLSAIRQPDTPGAEQVRSLSEDLDVQVEPMVPTVGNELTFRNRVDELNAVLNGLTNAAGTHFWHVVAPPQLGKTWFLDHISTHPRLTRPDPWVVRKVNLRSQPPDVHGDAAALLRLLFEREPLTDPGREMRLIAQQIGRTGNPNLCIVDSAELLTKQAADTLRLHLKEIGDHVQRIGNRRLRLAFIAASRRDEDWKGIIPQRLSPLSLTEFTADVIQEALRDLSKEMKTEFSADWFREIAVRVQGVTEGLPALLVKCLQWIREEHWFELERLEDQDRFEELLVPYVERELLTPANLLSNSNIGRSPNSLQALIQAYKILAPYRLFTRSHLRHHRDVNTEFRTALDNADWNMTDLWGAIGATTLVRRPSTELWKEIHPAIRRLLYRYFYRSDWDRATVHDEARQFMAMWSDKQVGTEQCIGLVEYLWHEANVMRLRNSADMGPRLTESAEKLSAGLGESTAYSIDELRAFAADRMRDDAELQEVVDSVGGGLLNRLVEIVLNPEGP